MKTLLPRVFGKSFPVSDTHLRSRGVTGLAPDEVLALVRARNRGLVNPVVAAFDHGSNRLHITRSGAPTFIVRQTKEVAVVLGFPKHLPLPVRASIVREIIPSAANCWLGANPARSELKSGCVFLHSP